MIARLASSRFLPGLFLLALAFAVLSPEFVTGPSTSDSFRYNIVWLDQWREGVLSGDLYPRWLPKSWDGLGSPTFYFYPPLYFWCAAAVDQLTLRSLETGTLISLTSALLLGGSGLAMRAWLLNHASAPASLGGAIAYMLAPYHLYDIFARAALAETCAYAVLPLLMLAMKRAGEGRFMFVPLLAPSYAALILAHLPIALLASVVMLPAYVLFLLFTSASPPVSRLAGLSIGGALGLGLASMYLVPALGLTSFILAEAFSGSFYRPERWFFWRFDLWSGTPVMWVVILGWTAATLFTAAAAVSARGRANRRETWFWCALGAVVLLLIAGVPPAFWQLPYVAQVQFPWRLMLVAEFVVITCVVLAAPCLRHPLTLAGAAVLALALSLVLLLVAPRLAASWHKAGSDLAIVRRIYVDAPEYLPAGSAMPLGDDGVPDPSRVRLPDRPLVAGWREARIDARALANGGIAVTVESPRPLPLVARRFAFPHWRVTDEAGRRVTTSVVQEHLIAWRAPAGRSSFRLEPGPAPGERAALAFSAASLALTSLIALALHLRRRRRQARSTPLEAAP